MPLYRLDFLAEDGTAAESVKVPAGWDYLSRHAQTARANALTTARETGRSILLTRIGEAGQTKPTLIIDPDGKSRAPAGMKSDHDSLARVCFCAACRAQRAAER